MDEIYGRLDIPEEGILFYGSEGLEEVKQKVREGKDQLEKGEVPLFCFLRPDEMAVSYVLEWMPVKSYDVLAFKNNEVASEIAVGTLVGNRNRIRIMVLRSVPAGLIDEV